MGFIMNKSVGFTLLQSVLVVVVVLSLFTGPSHGLQIEANDIQAFLNALDSNDSSQGDNIKGTHASQTGTWGVPDAVATVGKLFKYELPKGDNEATGKFKVSELGRDALPAWLDFDLTTNTLLGVPGPEHQGLQHYLEVMALESVAEQALARARDMFTVHVKEEKLHLDNSPPKAVPVQLGSDGIVTSMNHDTKADDNKLKPIQCPIGSSFTTASIILDVNLGMMKPREKAGMMESMCGHLQMPTELLRVVPVGVKPMFDSSALVAGPGDVKTPENPGALLQWEVGCGNVHSNQMPMLQTLEATASNGSMSSAVGHGVIGWHVTNTKLSAPKRLRRQVRIQATPTPQPSVGPPTRQPVPTRVIPKEETDGPSAIVPGGGSKHTHKHHRPSKTKGRHHSPHHKHSPKPTNTVLPTPSALPIQPTSVVKVRPTEVTPEMPPAPLPSPGSTTDGVESSMTPPLPGVTTSSTPTEILPTRPVEKPDIITTEPIKPTSTKDTSTPSTKSPEVIEPTEKTKPEPTNPLEVFNYGPIVKNNMQRINVEVGEVFDYKIPKNTFYDHEDGDTRNLKLVFLTVDGMSLPQTSWVKLNTRQQRLYGLPLPEHEGRQEYLMVAIDTGSKIARNPFEIDVKPRPMERAINHELSMTLDLDYKQFMVDVNQRMEVAKKVAGVFGDKDAKKMTITRIDEGSVIYAWSNNSLPTKPCPTREIANLVSYLLTENNTLREEAVEKMKPYKILKAGAERKGECAREEEEEERGVWSPDATDGGDTKEVASEPRENSDDDVFIRTVVPAVIIVSMLLLAALIACILYRKKRKGKLSDEDQRTFISKGIPIIFADELEEKPDPSAKPLIMADEKPPLPPPEYPRSNCGSAPSSPGSHHKEPLLDSGDDDLASTPYHPPPPLTGTNGSRGSGHRARAAQPYRQPYVQP